MAVAGQSKGEQDPLVPLRQPVDIYAIMTGKLSALPSKNTMPTKLNPRYWYRSVVCPYKEYVRILP
jgi:hypothetical protein